MALSHQRRKDPERVRRTILDRAIDRAAYQGLASLSIQDIADAAGVTKGGLFHHFPSKRHLIEAIVADLLGRIDAAIDALMEADPEPSGRFTRAYIRAMDDQNQSVSALMTALGVSMVTDPEFRKVWADWIAGRLANHRETDGRLEYEVVRLAADGLWFAHFLGQGLDNDPRAISERLIAMTYEPDRL